MISAERIRRTRDRRNAAVTERNSLSTWTVTRATGAWAVDPETGDSVPVVEPVWSGDAHFSDNSRPHVKVRADTALTIEGPTLCVAHDVVAFEVGDAVACDSSLDATLLGRFWRVTGKPGSSYGIDRHYPLEEVTS